MIPRVLTVAGSDSGGGAGIQGDIKTISAFGGYAMTAITALTAQNTQGVFAIHDVPPAFIADQMRLCLTDIGADVVKTGMLSRSEAIEAVADTLEAFAPAVPLVVDPVMVAKSGVALLVPEAVATLTSRLLTRAWLVTPNIPEAEILAAMRIVTRVDMETAARRIYALGPRHVLMKGGHLQTGDVVVNLLFDGQEMYHLEAPRMAVRHTHGTGCTMASALATLIGAGMPVAGAVPHAHAYVAGAIAHAPGFGQGCGPLWHMWQVSNHGLD